MNMHSGKNWRRRLASALQKRETADAVMAPEKIKKNGDALPVLTLMPCDALTHLHNALCSPPSPGPLTSLTSGVVVRRHSSCHQMANRTTDESEAQFSLFLGLCKDQHCVGC